MADLRAHGVLVGEGQRIETDKRIMPEDRIHRVTASPCPPVAVSPCPRPRRGRRGTGGGLRTGRGRRDGGRGESYARYGTGTLSNHRRGLEIHRGDTESAEGFERSQRPQRLCGELPSARGAGRLSAHPFPDALPELADEADLIVNTTSLGLHADDPLPWDAAVAVPARPGRLRSDLQSSHRTVGAGSVTRRNRVGRTGHVGSSGRPIGGPVDGKRRS